MGSAAEVFSRRKELPEIMPGVNPGVVTALDCPAAFLRAEQEMEFVEKNRLSCLTLKDEAYPSRLRECEDAPIVLFFKGNTDFNRLHVIDMVGTRRATDYGKQFCADFLRDLAVLCPDVLVVSGLAYGIDIHAHQPLWQIISYRCCPCSRTGPHLSVCTPENSHRHAGTRRTVDRIPYRDESGQA